MATGATRSGPAVCGLHRALAGWVCSGCHRARCPACARLTRLAHSSIVTCSDCGAYCEPVLRPLTFAPPKAIARDLAEFPVRAGGWLVIILCGLALGALKLVLVLGDVPAAVWFVMYWYSAAMRSADRILTIPPLADWSRLGDALAFGFKAGAAATFAFAPACLYFVERGRAQAWIIDLFHWHATAIDPALLVLVLLALLWLPGAVLLALAGMPLATVVNPAAAARVYARMGLSAQLLVPAAVVLVLLDALSDAVLDFHRLPDGYPNAFSEMVKLYLDLVLARACGVALSVRGDRIDFGAPADYLVPILGDVQPAAAPVVETIFGVPVLPLPAATAPLPPVPPAFAPGGSGVVHPDGTARGSGQALKGPGQAGEPDDEPRGARLGRR